MNEVNISVHLIILGIVENLNILLWTLDSSVPKQNVKFSTMPSNN